MGEFDQPSSKRIFVHYVGCSNFEVPLVSSEFVQTFEDPVLYSLIKNGNCESLIIIKAIIHWLLIKTLYSRSWANVAITCLKSFSWFNKYIVQGFQFFLQGPFEETKKVMAEKLPEKLRLNTFRTFFFVFHH